ncbi:hypothetical protein ACLOJK_000820 [Asimina triloba]
MRICCVGSACGHCRVRVAVGIYRDLRSDALLPDTVDGGMKMIAAGHAAVVRRLCWVLGHRPDAIWGCRWVWKLLLFQI